MCGICGFIGYDDPTVLTRMCRAMIHRGPDDEGVWFDQQSRVGLGHRRLAIIDTSPSGHQPMWSESGDIVISFNGEIYDFRKTRDYLIKKGYRFKSDTDTEVLVNLYHLYGIDFLKELNGMFALAIWDMKRRRLVLARDHAGVKPLYYWEQGRTLLFASEIKALLKVPVIERRLNPAAVPAYLTCLWVPGQETMFDGIQKIEPSSMLICENGNRRHSRWFEMHYDPEEQTSEKGWIDRVHGALEGAVRRQLISDVPLGAFLSGGLDSSAIVAFMKKLKPQEKPSCFTISFHPEDLQQDSGLDELPYAQKVAGILSADLYHTKVGWEILNLLARVIFHMDEPDADPTAILTYIVSSLAKQNGITVLLSGSGGDEIFFGYRSHQAYKLYNQLSFLPSWLLSPALKAGENCISAITGAQKPLARRLKRFEAAIGHKGADRHQALIDWSRPEIRRSLLCEPVMEMLYKKDIVKTSITKWYNDFKGQGDINRHSHILIQTFLAEHNFLYNDKCGMAVSLETRVPFMDIELMKLAASIPERLKLRGLTTKYIFKKVMERYLPADVIYRPKRGFAPPVRHWMANQMKPLFAGLLNPDVLRDRGLFKAETVDKLIKENDSCHADHTYLLYALLSLEIWHRTFIDRPGEEITL